MPLHPFKPESQNSLNNTFEKDQLIAYLISERSTGTVNVQKWVQLIDIRHLDYIRRGI
jgi:hypothetical protein